MEQAQTQVQSEKMLKENNGLDRNLMWSVAKSLIPGIKLTDEDVPVWRLVYQWAARDIEFTKQGYDLNKGLVLLGPCGTGKTTLITILNNTLKIANSPLSFEQRITWKVAGNFTEKGQDCINKFGLEHYFFDELGIMHREHAQHYGNKVIIGQEIILHRYNQFKACQVLTHFTTNLSEDELEENYGTRAYSRLKEMCNIIPYLGKDKRIESIAAIIPVADTATSATQISEAEVLAEFVRLSTKAYEEFKNKGHFFDMGNAIYDFLKSKGAITYSAKEADEFTELGKKQLLSKMNTELAANAFDPLKRSDIQRSISALENGAAAANEGKRIALNKFFQKLSDTSTEISDLLINIK